LLSTQTNRSLRLQSMAVMPRTGHNREFSVKSEWMTKLTAHAARSERTMRSLSPKAMLIALVLSGATLAKVAAQVRRQQLRVSIN
jgi:hypothetical protein